MDNAWRQTVTNQQTILTVIAGLAVPAIVTLMTQNSLLSVSEGRLLTYAIISLAIHIPFLLLTAHNDRRTAFMISQGQITDPWRIVLSRINNILYPIVNFSVLAAWLFLLLVLFNRINIDSSPPQVFEPNRVQYTNIVNSPWDMWSAIGTIFAALVALGIGLLGIKEIRAYIFSPKITPQERKLQKTEQKNKDGETFVYQRLIVKNSGQRFGGSANDVRTFLTYENGNQPELKNFIPIPLRWTYFSTFSRDISQGEPAYLDICAKKKGNDIYGFCWASDTAGSGSKSGVLENFDPKLGNLRLEFYERNGGRVGDMTLQYCDTEDCFKVIDWE